MVWGSDVFRGTLDDGPPLALGKEFVLYNLLRHYIITWQTNVWLSLARRRPPSFQDPVYTTGSNNLRVISGHSRVYYTNCNGYSLPMMVPVGKMKDIEKSTLQMCNLFWEILFANHPKCSNEICFNEFLLTLHLEVNFLGFPIWR